MQTVAISRSYDMKVVDHFIFDIQMSSTLVLSHQVRWEDRVTNLLADQDSGLQYLKFIGEI